MPNSDNLGHHSDTEVVGAADRTSYSGPLSGPLNKRPNRKSARFNLPEGATGGGSAADDYVEITLDVREDSVAVHSVKAAGGGEVEDPELALLAKGLEKRSSFGSSVVRSASSRIRQVSQELKRLASLTSQPRRGSQPGRFDRAKSAAAYALKGLKFISKTDGAAAWAGVEKRFNELTASTNGLLPRALFGECIGEWRLENLHRNHLITIYSILTVHFILFRDEQGIQGVRRRVIRRAGTAAEHHRGQHHESSA